MKFIKKSAEQYCENNLIKPQMTDIRKKNLRDTSAQSSNIVINKTQQGNTYFPGPNIGPCTFDKQHSFLNVAGNIFVLGLIVVINEILDLAASQSLNFLLQPCLSGNVAEEEETLDDVVADNIDSFIDV